VNYSRSKIQHPTPKRFTARKSLFKGALSRLSGLAAFLYRSSILHSGIESIVKYLEFSRRVCYIRFITQKNILSIVNLFIVHLIRFRALQGASNNMPETEHTDLSPQEPEQITISQAEEYLMKPYPVWLLTPQGFVISANLLVSWLWEAPQLSKLFDLNVFEIFYRNLWRIPEYKNDEFFRKKIPLLKRLIEDFGKEPYNSFLEYIKHDPYLKEIYDQVQYNPKKRRVSQRIWEYSLRILPPTGTGTTELLKFQVVVYRLSPGNEFLAVYEPHPSNKITQSIVGQKYIEATSVVDVIGYVQNKKDADKYQGSEQEGGELTINREQNPQRMHDTQKEIGHFGLDRGLLEQAVAVLAQAREQQLETLAQRKDFPQFVINELQEKLEAAKQERMDWEKVYGRTAEAE
jgi:hypothetical protein